MKGYWKILLILMLAVGFASCEDDQGEIEYVITGRAWTGDVGMNAHNGEPLSVPLSSGTTVLEWRPSSMLQTVFCMISFAFSGIGKILIIVI